MKKTTINLKQFLTKTTLAVLFVFAGLFMFYGQTSAQVYINNSGWGGGYGYGQFYSPSFYTPSYYGYGYGNYGGYSMPYTYYPYGINTYGINNFGYYGGYNNYYGYNNFNYPGNNFYFNAGFGGNFMW